MQPLILFTANSVMCKFFSGFPGHKRKFFVISQEMVTGLFWFMWSGICGAPFLLLHSADIFPFYFTLSFGQSAVLFLNNMDVISII